MGNGGGDEWFAGKITAILDRTYDISYDDGLLLISPGRVLDALCGLIGWLVCSRG